MARDAEQALGRPQLGPERCSDALSGGGGAFGKRAGAGIGLPCCPGGGRLIAGRLRDQPVAPHGGRPGREPKSTT
jgi:hypothetical protein